MSWTCQLWPTSASPTTDFSGYLRRLEMSLGDVSPTRGGASLRKNKGPSQTPVPPTYPTSISSFMPLRSILCSPDTIRSVQTEIIGHRLNRVVNLCKSCIQSVHISTTVGGRNPARLSKAYTWNLALLILFEDTVFEMDLCEWRKSCTTCQNVIQHWAWGCGGYKLCISKCKVIEVVQDFFHPP